MQPDTITIGVDELNDGILVNHEYKRFTQFPDRTVYVGPGHSVAMRNMMTLYRSFPKENGNFKGVAKISVKFTRDIMIPGVDTTTTIIAPEIVETKFSIPVGVTSAEALIERQKIVGILDMDSIMVSLTDQLMV